MTGDVAFMSIVGSTEAFLLWNSTQFSTGNKPNGEILRYILGRNLYCVSHSLPVFHVLLHDDQAKSQEKENDR